MLTETQDDLYFTRMKSSLGDKERLLPFINKGRVLDVGAGGGEFSEFLRLSGYDVVATDGSPEAVERIQLNFPNVPAAKVYSHHLPDVFAEQTFDSIVCSSILHEVYSYGGGKYARYDLDSVRSALFDFYKLLKPGGTLVIRDGVKPNDWQQQVIVHLKNDDSVRFLESYMKNAPFYSHQPDEDAIHFEKLSEHSYKMNYRSAMEFLYTLTWGWSSASREIQELYGVFTEKEYSEEISDKGFTVVHSEQYLQPGYPEHLNPVADISDRMGRSIALPSSNMIIVARRPL